MKNVLLISLLLCWIIITWCTVDTTDEDIAKLENKIEHLEDQIDELESTVSDLRWRVDEACEYHWC